MRHLQAFLFSALLGSLLPPHAATDPMEAALSAYEAGDLKAAARGFTALSARHLPLADYNLAMMHIRGELPKPDLRTAKRLLERAAARDFVSAEVALAQMYEQGLLGKPDLPRSTGWVAGAAAQGSG